MSAGVTSEIELVASVYSYEICQYRCSYENRGSPRWQMIDIDEKAIERDKRRVVRPWGYVQLCHFVCKEEERKRKEGRERFLVFYQEDRC